MCTILVAWRVVPGAPLVLAANRDEFLARDTGGPQVLRERPRAVGGVDLVAGGTWLAVAPEGRVAAVTNRRVERRDPTRRSRGELPLLLLAGGGDTSDDAALRGLDPAAYNPCNLLVASRDRALVAHLEGARPQVLGLTPGPHVLTTVDLDAAADAKVARLRAGMEAVLARSHPTAEVVERLERLLRDHGPDRSAGPDAACIHGDLYGTRSSSTVVLWEGGEVTYRHAAGPPCVTPMEDLSGLLRG